MAVLTIPFRYGKVEQKIERQPEAVTRMNDWDDLEAQFVTTLREQRIEPVPEPIVKMAQKSLDGVQNPDNAEQKLHSMQLVFDSEGKATAFARHMRNAGLHTNPPSSVTVIVDPERTRVDQVDAEGNPVMNDAGNPVKVPGPPVNPCKVAWRAGKRRGRASS
jgi:hypothetical protein